ncbi:MAG: peptidoglycan-binding domain-containing protein, partial [archaeon]
SSCVYKSYTPIYTPTYTPTYSATPSCPLNSHTSATDSTKCQCDIGFQTNTSKTACEIVPIKTENQSCQDTYGINSYSPTFGKCGCYAGYQWASDNKSCVLAPIKTNEQICQDSFGLNVIWDGTKNTDGTLNCNCKTGFSWKDSNKTSCVVTVNTNSPSSDLVFTKDLKLGSTGVDVNLLQNFLKKEGFYSGSATGNFDSSTQKAVKSLQKYCVTKQTGNVGSQTRSCLNGFSAWKQFKEKKI